MSLGGQRCHFRAEHVLHSLHVREKNCPANDVNVRYNNKAHGICRSLAVARCDLVN